LKVQLLKDWKSLLLAILLLLGLSFIVLAWYFSFPLSINSANDFIFYHISILYWIGLPLTLTSMYLIAIRSKSKNLHCVMTVGIFLALYSISYFYALLPGSDSVYFRGLNEYYLRTNNLATNQNGHLYYGWPSYFIITKVALLFSGLQLVTFEFFLYSLVGALIGIGLYKYFSKNNNIYLSESNERFTILPMIVFSLTMFNFFNYQAVPFSLAVSLLLLLIMVEKRSSSNFGASNTVLYLLIFIGICFIHLFVPLFFVLYLIVQYFLSRKARYYKLSLLTIGIYFAVQVFQAPGSFEYYMQTIFRNLFSNEYSYAAQLALASKNVFINNIAQIFSRIDFILAASICVIGFVVLLLRKRLSNIDKAFFVSSLMYAIMGIFTPILGTRAIPLAFIPISLGVYSFAKGRTWAILRVLLLVCLVFFVFASIHQTFQLEPQFQTTESYQAENYLLRSYNWSNAVPNVLSQRVMTTYLVTFEQNANFYDDYSQNYVFFNRYDIILYTPGLGESIQTQNLSLYNLTANSEFDLTYNNGYSYLFIKASNSLPR
jgi:hypothetical protein